MRSFSNRAFDVFAASGYAVVAYPNAVRREWNGARRAVMLSPSVKSIDDVGFLSRLVADVVARNAIDPQRVFCVGYSLGGQMTIRLLHDAPELLAGAALLASTLPADENLVVADDQTPRAIRVLSIHGTADPVTPCDGGQVSFRGLFPKGNHLSANDTAQYFAVRNGLDTSPISRWLAQESEHRVLITDYPSCERPPVTLYTVIGGGHQIPGASTGTPLLFGRPTASLSAVERIAEFFGLDQAR